MYIRNYGLRRGQSWHESWQKRVSVSATVCGFYYNSRKTNISYFNFFALVPRQNAAMSSATQHAMPPEFGGKPEAGGIFIYPTDRIYFHILFTGIEFNNNSRTYGIV